MTKSLNQIIFFFLHQNQNIFSATLGIRIFFWKKTITQPPTAFKLNGPSLTRSHRRYQKVLYGLGILRKRSTWNMFVLVIMQY